MKILVTGGAGFIGSEVVRQYLQNTNHVVINMDSLTYAGNLESLAAVTKHENYVFEKVDITDRSAVERVFLMHRPDAVMNLAAESHVDRSIDGPGAFINTNIMGTYTLLEVARKYWSELPAAAKAAFRFQHISTDEVYGSLGAEGLFSESSPYQPNSPYSASKAASDHLVRAWFHTYGMPVLTTNCSNNYGPYQFPEKLIPLMTINALTGKPLPVYGAGNNVRDWLYVGDHANALRMILEKGAPGEVYNIGGLNERQNIEIVHTICDHFDVLFPKSPHFPHRKLIKNVQDRPGHDQRYAIDASKTTREIGWRPKETFSTGIKKTIDWYVTNQPWWQRIIDGSYQGERLGLSKAKGAQS